MEVFIHSMNITRRTYPECDFIVCCNNGADTSFIKDINIYEQKLEEIGYPLEGPNKNEISKMPGIDGKATETTASGWKLSPPRLRPNAHELWIDNDIVIRDRIPELDYWLASPEKIGIISEGRTRFYGIFNRFIPNINLCAGFFGLPPNVDFKQIILDYCKLLNGRPLGGYDEQGLVCATVTNLPTFMVVPSKSVFIAEHDVPDPLPPALHFVGSNRSANHAGWNKYRQIRSKKMKLI
jgi:hypothetical protein